MIYHSKEELKCNKISPRTTSYPFKSYSYFSNQPIRELEDLPDPYFFNEVHIKRSLFEAFLHVYHNNWLQVDFRQN